MEIHEILTLWDEKFYKPERFISFKFHFFINIIYTKRYRTVNLGDRNPQSTACTKLNLNTPWSSIDIFDCCVNFRLNFVIFGFLREAWLINLFYVTQVKGNLHFKNISRTLKKRESGPAFSAA